MDGFVKFNSPGPILWFPFVDIDGIVCMSLLSEIRAAIGLTTGLDSTPPLDLLDFHFFVELCRLKLFLKSCRGLFNGFINEYVMMLKYSHVC